MLSPNSIKTYLHCRSCMVALSLVLHFFSIDATCAATSRTPSRNELSIQETLAVALYRPTDSQILHIYSRANNQAKAQLYRLLQDIPENRIAHTGVVMMLGYVGGDEDAKKLQDLVQERFTGVLAGGQDSLLHATFFSLSVMARRGVRPAQDIVDQMMTPSYWANARFRWLPKDIASKITAYPPFEYKTASFVLVSYARAGNLDVRGKAARMMSFIDDPAIKRQVSAITAYLLNDQARSEQVLAQEQRKLTEDDRRNIAWLSAAHSALIKNAIGIRPPLNEGESPLSVSYANIVREARKTLDEVSSQLRSNAMNALVQRLSVEQRPGIDPAQVEIRLKARFMGDFARQKLAFQSLLERNLSPSHIRVKRLRRYAFDGLEDGQLVRPRQGLTWRVAFTYDGTAEVGRVLFWGRRGGETVAQDGTLTVVLVKSGDRWLWRPFGW